MRKILWLPILTAVCAFTSLRADVTIVQRIHAEGYADEDTTTMIKAGRMRVDYTPGGLFSSYTSAIINRKSGEMIEMKSPQRIYLKTALSGFTKQRQRITSR